MQLSPKQEKKIKKADAELLVNEHFRATAKKFAHIERKPFLNELLQRIENPKLINQGSTDFCGPAAALYSLCKDDPVSYAQLAISLFEQGKATVRGWNIEVGGLANEEVPQEMNIGPCDWVTMASLRRNVGFGALTAVTYKAQGALPFEIATCFERFGYRKVLNETFSTAASKVFWNIEDNLKTASQLFSVKQYRVVLCVNLEMFEGAAGTPLKPNHFCTLKSDVTIKDRITCRLWQWGIDNKEPTAGAAIHVDLPKAKFLAHYFGFIAAGDLDFSHS
jgi:hypothetical protein